ncbi:phosphoglycerate mutase family protein [Lactobacillus sp. ESL0731]|uniref:histidine phosphatase family protein n=1 Tax=unclassified Lactobacillus TaxID=2620435 RepID=UPI0023F818B3|nr:MULTISPECIES: histidine phosphatase family protein [unclassified Lactobacillus]WEV51489.1 phosphoglycerate mutase family protein [Lactobacillus sp. ESL0700]WEV62618.1 phosphoglycerate mutase family protein [Lactobacillus sp. ESL0731]
MKDLYLMRHGETIFNQRKLVQGAVDSPLTAAGIKEAAKMGTYLKEQGLTFDHAFASTQERASDTLELVTKQPYERLKGLKEWDFGLFEAQPEYLLPKFIFTDTAQANFFVPYGGEAAMQVMDRMDKTISKIMATPANQQVLVVSHGAAILMFLVKWMTSTEIAKIKDLPNCSVLHFTYDTATGKFAFVEMFEPHKL